MRENKFHSRFTGFAFGEMALTTLLKSEG